MYFYESVEFETRQKTTKGLNKPNAVKKLKKIEVYRYKKTSEIQRLIRNNSLVLIPRIELGTSPLPRVRSTNWAISAASSINILKGKPGSDLLSHKRTLHYHRRDCISLLCSEWEQVVLQHYGRQANRVN